MRGYSRLRAAAARELGPRLAASAVGAADYLALAPTVGLGGDVLPIVVAGYAALLWLPTERESSPRLLACALAGPPMLPLTAFAWGAVLAALRRRVS